MLTARPLWCKTLCLSSIHFKDRSSLRLRLLGWLSLVPRAFFSHYFKSHPTVSRAVQSLPVPLVPVPSSCVAWGTSACPKPQIWVAMKHEACLKLEISKSLKYYCSLKAVDSINVWALWNLRFSYSEPFCYFKWKFSLTFCPVWTFSMFCISVWEGSPEVFMPLSVFRI